MKGWVNTKNVIQKYRDNFDLPIDLTELKYNAWDHVEKRHFYTINVVLFKPIYLFQSFHWLGQCLAKFNVGKILYE